MIEDVYIKVLIILCKQPDFGINYQAKCPQFLNEADKLSKGNVSLKDAKK